VLFQDGLIASWVSPGSARLLLDSHILPAAAQKASGERWDWERRYRWALSNKALVSLASEHHNLSMLQLLLYCRPLKRNNEKK